MALPPFTQFRFQPDGRGGFVLTQQSANLLIALLKTREIEDGGTGATNATDARANLGLGTSDDVEFNDVTVNGDFSASGAFQIEGTAPRVRLFESDAATDQKNWDLAATGGSFALQTWSDDFTTGENVWVVNKSGDTVTRHRIYIGNSVKFDLDDDDLNLTTNNKIVIPNRLQVVGFSIADDDTVTLDFLENVFAGRLSVMTNSNSVGLMDFRVRLATSPGCTELNTAFGSKWTAYAGTTLTGTTGVDGTVNVSALPNGEVIIENRSGNLVSFRALLLG